MNILHLEDDGPLREILAAALKAVEPTCEIHQFVESDKAIQYALDHTQGIDLFILDIRVPGSMDGLEVARRVRAMNCSGAIVLTSAYRAPAPELIKELNCEWYPKPWHIYQTISKLFSLARKNTSSTVPLSKPASKEAKPNEPVSTLPKPDKVKPNEPVSTLSKPDKTKPNEPVSTPPKADEKSPIEKALPPRKPDSPDSG